ncbi:MAG: hypothetical protein WCG26_11765 [Chloroflexales bacterium]
MARYTKPGKLLLANSIKSAVVTAAVVASIGGWVAFGVTSPNTVGAAARQPVSQERPWPFNGGNSSANSSSGNVQPRQQPTFSFQQNPPRRFRTRSSR